VDPCCCPGFAEYVERYAHNGNIMHSRNPPSDSGGAGAGGGEGGSGMQGVENGEESDGGFLSSSDEEDDE
jgi:hypothetical protein